MGVQSLSNPPAGRAPAAGGPPGNPPEGAAAGDPLAGGAPGVFAPAEGSITLDSRGRVQSLTPDCAAVFGCRLAEIVGRNIKQFLPEGFLPCLSSPAARDEGVWVAGRRKSGAGFFLRFVISESGSGEDRQSVALLKETCGLEEPVTPVEPEHASAELRRIRGELGDARAALETVRRRLSELETLSTTLRKERDTEARKALETSELAARLKGELDAALASGAKAQARWAEEKDQLQTQAADLAEARSLLDESRLANDTLRRQTAAAQEETAQAVQRHGQFEQHIQELNDQANRLKSELDVALARSARAHQESRATGLAIEEVAKELASARLVLSTLQSERDQWKSRSEESETAARAQAARADELARNVHTLEEQGAQAAKEGAAWQQEARQWRGQHQEALRQRDDAAQDLARVSAERDRVRAEDESLRGQFQSETQQRARMEQELRAAGEISNQVSRELAAARVVLETLRQERDQWKSLQDQTLAELHDTRRRLAEESSARQWVDQSVENALARLFETLNRKAPDMAALLVEFRDALAERHQAESTLAQAQQSADAATARSSGIEEDLRFKFAQPLQELLTSLSQLRPRPGVTLPAQPAPPSSPAQPEVGSPS